MTPPQEVSVLNALEYALRRLPHAFADDPQFHLHLRNVNQIRESAANADAQAVENGERQSGVIDDTKEQS